MEILTERKLVANLPAETVFTYPASSAVDGWGHPELRPLSPAALGRETEV